MTEWIVASWNHLRDAIAYRVIRFTMNNIATRDYQRFLTGSMRYGMAAAARDTLAEEDQ